MRVYGHCMTDVPNGELRAADVTKSIYDHFGPEHIAIELQWDYAFRSLNDAKAKLLDEMIEFEELNEGTIDPEIFKTVRSYKASFIPVEQDIR